MTRSCHDCTSFCGIEPDNPMTGVYSHYWCAEGVWEAVWRHGEERPAVDYVATALACEKYDESE